VARAAAAAANDATATPTHTSTRLTAAILSTAGSLRRRGGAAITYGPRRFCATPFGAAGYPSGQPAIAAP
jgi:hypothetical protein